MSDDRLEAQRAKDRAEYDEAVRIVQWLRARALERRARGHFACGQVIGIAANKIADSFLVPLE